MKAIVRDKYGYPEVMRIEEVPKPVPGKNEVLIKVHAVSASAADKHFLTGTPFAIRFMAGGIFKPVLRILGADIAGVVESAGENVSEFKVGDEVFGDISECGWGGFAEYTTATSDAIALKPSNISFEQAAATPMSAITALHGLENHGGIKPGQKVLINGAAGGVGSFAVQIAKSFDTEVTAVCSMHSVDLMSGLGADHVIDYKKQDYAKTGEKYDIILDTAAYRNFKNVLPALSDPGAYVLIGGSLSALIYAGIFGPSASKGGQKIITFTSLPDKSALLKLKELLETGEVVPLIAKTFTFVETPKALQYLVDGHTQGKVVVTVV